VDSDPPNAQIQVNLRGEGVTPQTVKVAPGPVFVEVQKDGFKKGFRKVEVGNQATRVAFRLVDRAHDRQELAQAHLALLVKGKTEVKDRPQTLSRLAQSARAEILVLVSTQEGLARILFFDAERGAVTGDPIESAYDATGRVAALAERAAPPARAAAPRPAAAAPAGSAAGATPPGPGASATPAPLAVPAAPQEALPEARAQGPAAVARTRRREKESAPWWGWAIAGLVAGAFIVYIVRDRPQEVDTLRVRARYEPPAD
jgi:hypothetical protein